MNNKSKITFSFIAIRSTKSTCSSETPSETVNVKRSIDKHDEQSSNEKFNSLKMDEIMDNDMQDKTAHISPLTKTPASFLYEYATKKNLVLKYNIIYNGISQQKVSFKYSVSLDSYETVGEGSSKKQAKQIASLHLLKKMADDKYQSLDTEFKKWGFDKYIYSTDHNIKENTVEQLNGICSSNKLGLPNFTLVQEEGPAHAKLFTISCIVSNVVETATHRTKKQAKHLAAVQMMNKLVSFDTNKLRTLAMKIYNQPDSTKIVEKVVSIKKDVDKKTSMLIDENMASYHLSFKKNMWQCCKTLNWVVEQFLKDGNLSNIKDPCKTLQDIINECKMSLTGMTVKEDILTQDNIFVYGYTIDSIYPPINAIGLDSHENTAKYEATINLLNMLCLLYK